MRSSSRLKSRSLSTTGSAAAAVVTAAAAAATSRLLPHLLQVIRLLPLLNPCHPLMQGCDLFHLLLHLLLEMLEGQLVLLLLPHPPRGKAVVEVFAACSPALHGTIREGLRKLDPLSPVIIRLELRLKPNLRLAQQLAVPGVCGDPHPSKHRNIRLSPVSPFLCSCQASLQASDDHLLWGGRRRDCGGASSESGCPSEGDVVD